MARQHGTSRFVAAPVRGRGTLAAAALGALGLLLVTFLWVGGASADQPAVGEDTLRLSADRIHWSPSLSEPLFDPAVQWLPGETGHRVLYVRNDGIRTSEVELAVSVRADPDAGDGRWAVVSLRGDSAGWTSLRGPDSTTLMRSMTLAPGQLRRVELGATLDPQATTPAMARRLRIAVDVQVSADRVDQPSATHSWLRLGTGTLGGTLALAALVISRSSRRGST